MADRPPVIAAWGAGVDSTAMIVELAERGDPIDMVLFADPGAEKSRTYAYIPLFREWMAERGIASEIVRYKPRNFKHWPPYAGIAKNMLTNATLPSVVFGGRSKGACSLGPVSETVSFIHTSKDRRAMPVAALIQRAGGGRHGSSMRVLTARLNACYLSTGGVELRKTRSDHYTVRSGSNIQGASGSVSIWMVA